MDQTQPKLTYQKLSKTGIRLVAFRPPTDQDAVCLRLRDFEMDTAPPYVALSYAWGDPTHTTPIKCNNCTFGATINLYNALLQIQKLSGEYTTAIERHLGQSHERGLYLWIDAICIDQSSDEDKAIQIPRMGEIFSTAFTVLVWLGTIDNFLRRDPSADRIGLDKLQKQLDAELYRSSFGMSRVHNLDELAKRSITVNDHPAVDAYIILLKMAWFARSWTVQEVCLSQREPIVLLSSLKFSLQAIYSFPDVLSEPVWHTLPDADFKTAKEKWLDLYWARIFVFGTKYLPSYISTPQYQVLPPADRLLLLLRLIAFKGVSVPHDKIYSLLGLLHSEDLLEDIHVDYNQRFVRFCVRISRMLIERTSDLRLLEHQMELRDRPDAALWKEHPSWAADFRYLFFTSEHLNVKHSGYFLPQSTGLAVHGVRMGTGTIHWSHDNHIDTVAQKVANIRHLHAVFLAHVTSQISATEDELWQRWWRFQVAWMALDRPSIYISLNGDTGSFDEYVSKLEGSEVVAKGTDYLLMREYCFFNDGTGQGKFARCRTRIQRPESEDTGMEVWALKGAMNHYILQIDADGRYRYLGYIYYVEDWGKPELDDEFFATRMAEAITIV